MHLLLRSYFGLKHFQMLQLLSAIVLCHRHLHVLGEPIAALKEKHCLDAKLKCVTSSYNPSVGVWYNPTDVAAAVCATDTKSCRKFTNQCEFERANCRGETWKVTKTQLCDSLNTGETGSCNCTLSVGCSQKTNICARKALRCKNFKNECEMEKAICLGKRWTKANSLFCCQFKENEERACRITSARHTCATIDYETCHAFSSKCEMSKLNERTSRKWHELSDRHCMCLDIGSSGSCGCKRRP